MFLGIINFINRVYIWLIVGSVITFLLRGLESPAGYVKIILCSILYVLIWIFENIFEIIDTPFASLTILKILILAFCCFLAWLAFVWWGWSTIDNIIRRYKDKKAAVERELEKVKEDSLAKSRKSYADFIYKMNLTDSQDELDIMIYDALEVWPEKGDQLSDLYKQRRKWLRESQNN